MKKITQFLVLVAFSLLVFGCVKYAAIVEATTGQEVANAISGLEIVEGDIVDWGYCTDGMGTYECAGNDGWCGGYPGCWCGGCANQPDNCGNLSGGCLAKAVDLCWNAGSQEAWITCMEGPGCRPMCLIRPCMADPTSPECNAQNVEVGVSPDTTNVCGKITVDLTASLEAMATCHYGEPAGVFGWAKFWKGTTRYPANLLINLSRDSSKVAAGPIGWDNCPMASETGANFFYLGGGTESASPEHEVFSIEYIADAFQVDATASVSATFSKCQKKRPDDAGTYDPNCSCNSCITDEDCRLTAAGCGGSSRCSGDGESEMVCGEGNCCEWRDCGPQTQEPDACCDNTPTDVGSDGKCREADTCAAANQNSKGEWGCGTLCGDTFYSDGCELRAAGTRLTTCPAFGDTGLPFCSCTAGCYNKKILTSLTGCADCQSTGELRCGGSGSASLCGSGSQPAGVQHKETSPKCVVNGGIASCSGTTVEWITDTPCIPYDPNEADGCVDSGTKVCQGHKIVPVLNCRKCKTGPSGPYCDTTPKYGPGVDCSGSTVDSYTFCSGKQVMQFTRTCVMGCLNGGCVFTCTTKTEAVATCPYCCVQGESGASCAGNCNAGDSSTACPKCGTKYCGENCSWGPCQNMKDCNPGQTKGCTCGDTWTQLTCGGDCTWPPCKCHTQCIGGYCKTVPGEGSDECSGNAECQHTECGTYDLFGTTIGMCMAVLSKGTDQCTVGCPPGQTSCPADCNHTECTGSPGNRKCTNVPSQGTNQCATAEDCDDCTGPCCESDACTPGQSSDCGNCGHQSCGADCTMGPCVEPPNACTPGTTRIACGQTQTCSAGCTWFGSSSEGCKPGETKPCPCGGPSLQCGADCKWIGQCSSHNICSGTSCICVTGSGMSECGPGKGCSHTECVDGTCKLVPGAGADQCGAETKCNHKVCNDVTHLCITVNGSGEDNCPNNCLQCTQGQVRDCGKCGEQTCNSKGEWGPCQNEGVCESGETKDCACGGKQTCTDCQWDKPCSNHSICENGICKCTPTAGNDECSGDGDCKHLDCNPTTRICELFIGKGADKCKSTDDCVDHTICNDDDICETVPGQGEDECETDIDCEKCLPGSKRDCGTKCGDQTCGADGKWGPCLNEGVCSSGDTDSCFCGGSRSCNSLTCQWTDCPLFHSVCEQTGNQDCVCVTGSGIDKCASSAFCKKCTPYTSRPCGNCGTQSCKPDGTWDTCQNQGSCKIGDSRPCTGCGGGNQTCNSQCQWGPCPSGHNDCIGEQCTCHPIAGTDTCLNSADCVECPIVGAIRTCGNCGEQECLSTHRWSQCTGQGECVGGTTRNCACGIDTQLCDPVTCLWGPCPTGHKICDGATCRCTPGAGVNECSINANCRGCTPSTSRPCGNCGTQVCKADGTWDECTGQGECSPDEERDCICTTGKQVCSDQCAWDPCPNLHSICQQDGGEYTGDCNCILGSGFDECAAESECKHNECNNILQCILLNGPGDSECIDDQGCERTPPEVQEPTIFPPNYCVGAQGFAQVTIQWKYFDQDGNHESGFMIQIDDDPSFGHPEIYREFSNVDNPSETIQTQIITIKNEPTVPGGEYLTYGTTYYTQVLVFDSTNLDSGFVNFPAFTTVAHPYPFTEFVYFPTAPQPETEVEFTDLSLCYTDALIDPVSCQVLAVPYTWVFGDHTTPDNTPGNVFHTYMTQGSYPATLNICDLEGYCCLASHRVQVKIPSNNPDYQEIWPFW